MFVLHYCDRGMGERVLFRYHECVKVVRAGRNAVIHIKLVQEDGKLIFSVKNPVEEKVQSVLENGMHLPKDFMKRYILYAGQGWHKNI